MSVIPIRLRVAVPAGADMDSRDFFSLFLDGGTVEGAAVLLPVMSGITGAAVSVVKRVVLLPVVSGAEGTVLLPVAPGTEGMVLCSV